MNNIIELLNEVKLQKKGLSLVMDDQDVTSQDIINTFFNLSCDVQNLGVQYFRLDAYNIVFGDNILKIQYTKDDKVYYMMVGANGLKATSQQIAVGTAIADKVYMMCETFPGASSIDLIAFPKFAINQKVRGLPLGSYRDTIRLFGNVQTMPNNDSLKCLEAGFEAIDAFCSLINQVKNQDKRKKLSI